MSEATIALLEQIASLGGTAILVGLLVMLYRGDIEFSWQVQKTADQRAKEVERIEAQHAREIEQLIRHHQEVVADLRNQLEEQRGEADLWRKLVIDSTLFAGRALRVAERNDASSLGSAPSSPPGF